MSDTDRDITRRSTGRRTADAVVTYEVRDLLAEIKAEQSAGFARIERSMDSKADRAELLQVSRDVDDSTKRVDGHDQRLTIVERWQKREDDRRSDQAERTTRIDSRWLAWGPAALATAGGIVVTILSATHHL